MKKDDINHIMKSASDKKSFSGVVGIKQNGGGEAYAAYGFADRADERLNNQATRFGIASGCKLFTSVAICQLVENGSLQINTKLKDCLDHIFPFGNEDVTIHHLLTHTSGMPDYFNEATMDDFEQLWERTPMYSLRRFITIMQHILY
nr:serine hydrolase domain-containing protein [Thalassobacillus sp. CUG 92003]